MKKFKKQKTIDSFCAKKESKEYSDWLLAKFIQDNRKEHILFSKYGKTKNFKTESLSFHFVKKVRGKKVNFKRLDGIQPLSYPISFNYLLNKRRIDIYALLQNRYLDGKNYFQDFIRGSVNGISPVKMWNVSIVGALIFGMFLMTFIYRYLGQGVSAVSNRNNLEISAQGEAVAGDYTEKALSENEENPWNKDGDDKIEDYVSQIMKNYQEDSENEQELKGEIKEMTKGYPIEKMASFIAKQDRIIAAFLVAIAKKESNWGKRVPVLNGQDCYNYWGYRGKRERMGTGGHTCFDSPEDAVKTVSKRLEFLVSSEKLNTPAKLIVWKCGYDCSWDNPVAVRKWINDIDHYFKKFDKFSD